MREETRQTLRLAGDAIASDGQSAGRDERVLAFLAYLGEGAGGIPAGDRDLAALLSVASLLDRLFELPVPDAPGLFCFGAQVTASALGALSRARGSVSGMGGTRIAAFRACVAEAAEFASQFECENETRAGRAGGADSALPAVPLDGLAGAVSGPDADAASTDAAAYGEAVACDLGRGIDVALPAGLVWRRREGDAAADIPFAPGLGVAAGRDAASALRHALFEWIERDAVALWWRGGRPARGFPQEVLAEAAISRQLAAWRCGRTQRRTWFLDLTTDLGIPVAAALSVDASGGRFAYGFAARGTPAEALSAALRELMQIELADRLVEAKRAEAGEAGLNDTDRIHLARRDQVRHDWPILQPVGIAVGNPVAGQARDREDRGAEPLAALLHAGFPVLSIDLTRASLGINVTRVLIPGLQPDPGRIITTRLARQRDAHDAIRGGSTYPPLY
ncbi:YcaO-like family protein [Stappia sp.]|uniref:YcaO-like family protein n=1 Tax=Stappia sp. TaxID=1870903 RepID=UPI003A998160